MSERIVSTPTEQMVIQENASYQHHDQGSLHNFVERASDMLDNVSGSEEGNEKPLRLAAFVGSVVLVTALATNMPNNEAARFMSEALGAFGGAFAGDKLRPVSRKGRFNKRKWLESIRETGEIDPTDLSRYFGSFDDHLTSEEIRSRLLGRAPGPDEKPTSDSRYVVIDLLSTKYRDSRGEPKTQDERRMERREITDVIMKAQFEAAERKNSIDFIKREGYRRLADIGVGFAAGLILTMVIDTYFNSSQGGYIGIIDDALALVLILGSTALRDYEAKNNSLAPIPSKNLAEVIDRGHHPEKPTNDHVPDMREKIRRHTPRRQ